MMNLTWFSAVRWFEITHERWGWIRWMLKIENWTSWHRVRCDHPPAKGRAQQLISPEVVQLLGQKRTDFPWTCAIIIDYPRSCLQFWSYLGKPNATNKHHLGIDCWNPTYRLVGMALYTGLPHYGFQNALATCSQCLEYPWVRDSGCMNDPSWCNLKFMVNHVW
jgi:hypothetical protein